MSVLICKMCGGDLDITEGMTTAKCPYCGTNQTLPKLNNEQRLRLYDRANHFRRSNDYDKAMAVYEQILNEDQTDSEAYWSIVLCRYGIEYVEDPVSHKRIPTVNRAQYTSILADEDYKAALRYADVVQARLYEQEAETIDGIQKGILQVSQREDPYDIFICYKETDDGGNRTRDSVLADELYYQLTGEGFKVFLARITLEDKLGTAYEPYIFAALHSARVMVVLGTRPENFQAVWVKNEWSRYLSLIRNGEKKVLIPAYRDMDPYDLPKEFSHLQALDMSRLGFIQDLLRGVRKILGDSAVHTGAANLDASHTDTRKTAYPDSASLTGAKGIDYQPSGEKVRSTGWEPYGWKRGVALVVVLVLAILLLNAKGIYQRWKMDHQEATLANTEQAEKENSPSPDGREGAEVQQAEQENEKNTMHGILEQLVSYIYQCPANMVSDSQLAKIQQLSIKRDWETWQVGYSFEAPLEDLPQDSGDGFVWLSLSPEEELDLNGITRFSGLKKLDVDDRVTASDIKGMQLEGISAYFLSPAEAAEILENPAAVKELGFNAGVDSLDGIDLFENLETLSFDYSEIDNVDALIHVGHLKNLSMHCDETLTDFTVLEKLSDLEKLSLTADGLKTIDFVSRLGNLYSLEITGGKLRTLSGLENCPALRSLSVTGCMELKDMSAVSELENLQELALEVPYGCPEPNLDKLTGLKKLSLDMFQDCTAIQNMTELTELHLYGGCLTKGLDLSRLTSLRELSCTSFTGFELEMAALEPFGMLERLDLSGASTYDDISGLFGMPNLKELNISGMQCEIDFDAVPENSTLEILHMDDMYLYENVQVDYFSGITMADWDEVILDEHTDFLKKLSGLKELYLSKDALTDIAFAEELPALEILDISENYITQLRPLAGLPSLKKVICTGNPLKNEKVLKDSVLIITD